MSPLAHICAGCSTITLNTGLCPTCRRAADHRRNTRPHVAVYQSPQWRKTRKLVLERDDHTCVLCGMPASTVDHHPLPLPACTDPYDMTNLRSLCPPCHGASDAPRAKQGGGGQASRRSGALQPHASQLFTETRSEAFVA